MNTHVSAGRSRKPKKRGDPSPAPERESNLNSGTTERQSKLQTEDDIRSLFEKCTFRVQGFAKSLTKEVRSKYEENINHRLPDSSQIVTLGFKDKDKADIEAQIIKYSTVRPEFTRLRSALAENVVDHVLTMKRIVFRHSQSIAQDSDLSKSVRPDGSDFILKRKDGGETSLDVKMCSESPNYRYFIIDGEDFESDYAIAVRILEEPAIESAVAIWGYLTKDEVLKFRVRKEGEFPCRDESGRAIRLDRDPDEPNWVHLHPIGELWDRLQSECQSWDSLKRS